MGRDRSRDCHAWHALAGRDAAAVSRMDRFAAPRSLDQTGRHPGPTARHARTLFPHPPGYVSLGAAWDGRGHHVVGPNPSPYRAVVDRADAQWAMRPWRLS